MSGRLIDPDDLRSAEQVADMLGLYRSDGRPNSRAVSTYRARYPDFPAPVWASANASLWVRQDIEAWAETHPRRQRRTSDGDEDVAPPP